MTAPLAASTACSPSNTNTVSPATSNSSSAMALSTLAPSGLAPSCWMAAILASESSAASCLTSAGSSAASAFRLGNAKSSRVRRMRFMMCGFRHSREGGACGGLPPSHARGNDALPKESAKVRLLAVRNVLLLVVAGDVGAPGLGANRALGFPHHVELAVSLHFADEHRLVQVMVLLVHLGDEA